MLRGFMLNLKQTDKLAYSIGSSKLINKIGSNRTYDSIV